MIDNIDVVNEVYALLSGIMKLGEKYDKALSRQDGYWSDNIRLTEENSKLKSEIDSKTIKDSISFATRNSLAEAAEWKKAFEIATDVLGEFALGGREKGLKYLGCKLEEAGIDVDIPEE